MNVQDLKVKFQNKQKSECVCQNEQHSSWQTWVEEKINWIFAIFRLMKFIVLVFEDISSFKANFKLYFGWKNNFASSVAVETEKLLKYFIESFILRWKINKSFFLHSNEKHENVKNIARSFSFCLHCLSIPKRWKEREREKEAHEKVFHPTNIIK